ncbi:hypothetical protein C0989_007169 [Termitomyces sp. Mn162]|nr:hypothetical protein C0989_007169 [Termitomyces sp. Mn162]
MDIINMSVVGITSDLNRTKQTVEAHAGHLTQNKVDIVVLWGRLTTFKSSFKSPHPPVQPASSTSSLSPMLASTLALIAEAEEPNNDEAAQPKEDESKMDCTTTVAIAVDQSAIAEDSALISDPIAIVTNSGISSRPTAASIDPTGPTASITDLAITTNSVISTRPAAIITNSTIATRLAASNESTVPTGVETVLASPIAATGHLMKVDMIGPAPLHPPDELVPQCGHRGKRKADEHAEEAVAKKMKEA